MIKVMPFANSLALTTAGIYLIFWLLATSAPDFFSLLFNAQFLGADLASLVPANQDFTTVLVPIVAVAATAWVIGYFWASLYNRLAK